MTQSIAISKKERNAISILRVLSMASIVVCHILQTLDNNWAWVLNIGVQVFLILSGYLYGHKGISDWKKWGIGRFKKLYIPYIIYVLLVLSTYSIIGYGNIGIKDWLVYITNTQGIIGGSASCLGHLWYMTAIAICYLITPLLQLLKKWASICTILFLIICLVEYYIYSFRLGIFSWIFLYVIGYYLPNVSKSIKYVVYAFLITTLIYSLSQITWDEIKHVATNSVIMHNAAGFLVVILGVLGLNKLHLTSDYRFLSTTDSISYYVFITHVFFVRPPHQILELTSYLSINIVIAMILTILTAYILRYVSERISKLIL